MHTSIQKIGAAGEVRPVHEFPHLFSPFRLGPVELKNRIVMAPHGVSFLGGHGSSIQRVIDYHLERARGGAGMIVMSNFMVPPSWLRLGSWGGLLPVTPLGNLDVLNEPTYADAYGKLVDGLAHYGARFVAQLNAGGRQHATPGVVAYGLPLLGPSAIPCPRTGAIPKAMTLGEIAEFVDTFAESARRVKAFGGDGVEIFAAQGYLLSSFLSASTNRREDVYGGDLASRMRFLSEVVEAVRSACGSEFVVGVRMNGNDQVPGGTTLKEATAVAERLGRSGMVDYLNVSGMTYAAFPGWIADMTAPEALFADDAGAIRSACGLPVSVVSRISSPAAAERILERGQADLVGMARALISDPDLPNKAARGDVEDIRLCTYSNQSCIMGLEAGRGMGCLHNPAVGKETHLGEGRLRKAERLKRVVVVGGGPAGMAAARVAAERGHKVILVEKSKQLGGQNLLTSMMPMRKGFHEVTRWLTHRVSKLKVEVILDHEVDAAAVLSYKPDAVIVATGSRSRRSGFTSFRPDRDGIEGLTGANAWSAAEALINPAALGASVLVIEDDPHLTGVFVAEHLASLGKKVTIVTPHIQPGRELVPGHLPAIFRRLSALGVTIQVGAIPERIEVNTLWCVETYGTRRFPIGPADGFVLAMGNIANDRLLASLERTFENVIAAGDCVTPRRIDNAIFEGERAGATV